MLLPAIFLALLVASPLPGPARGTATATVPDEPGVVVLPDAQILQAVAADVDADGRREVVRLVLGAGDAVLAEIWELDARGWQLRGEPVEVVPPSRVGTRIDPRYQATPVRLLVRRVQGAERVSVASQPHFEEIDIGPPCCLVLHDLAISDGSAVIRSVSGRADFSDVIIVIDLDGDGTDELLSTESLPTAGNIEFPIEARVHRWADGAFGTATETPFRIGSGDSPFRLGDSDGVPGEEAAILSKLGPPGIFRMRLGDNDSLLLDAGGLVADEAVAVPVAGGRGVAVAGPVVGLMVAEWPVDAEISAPYAESSIADPMIVGTVDVGGQPRLVVHQAATDAVHMLGLPDLLPPQGVSITRSPAAAALSGVPLAPFSGSLPGGAVDGEPAVIHAGRLIPSFTTGELSGTSLVASLAGAEPLGLVGDGDLIVLHHGPVARPNPGPDGGVLLAPSVLDESWTSIAPLELMRQPEPDDGALDPPLRGVTRVDERNGIAVGPGGFVAEVTAPPGSRVVVADFDPSVVRTPIVVPDTGRVDAPFVPPTVTTANPRYQATLLVLTPAGHAQLARWDVHVLNEPPPVEVTASTSFGSTEVEIVGRTASYATVRVDGVPIEVSGDGRFTAAVALPPWPTDVTVEVSDPHGNVARHAVSGIGLFDYRGLPWAPISASLVALAGVVLLLRVPRSSPLPRRPDDDSALEELEPD
ncbi:MAG TPA: hypothetical protein VEW95_06725 [Candidatus Limnocylindrales bacterium]|nr:hypothetical protein [Candidatus Limnocylindrales bacterium]